MKVVYTCTLSLRLAVLVYECVCNDKYEWVFAMMCLRIGHVVQ